MAKTNLGRVSLVPSGEYDSSANYKKLDVVSNDGSMYICKKDCIGVPTDNEEYWLKAVQKGDTGEQGPMPVNGVDYNTAEEKESFKNEVVENTTKEVEENIEKIEKEAIKNFNDNVTTKTTSFDNNAATKTNTFNTNATQKTSDFDTNATEKTNAFNENYEEKMLTFEELQKKVEELESENELLKNQIPTGEVEGNYIHLTDSSNMNCDVSLVGNSKQATREGYNKLPIIYESGSVTTHGITVTYNKDTGLFKIVGTPTEASWINIFPIFKSGTGSSDAGEGINVNGKYLISNYSKWDSASKMAVMFTDDTNTITQLNYAGLTYMKFNTETINRGWIYIPAIGIELNEEFWIMVTDTYENQTYEQYGVSPSLEYPSKVASVEGSAEVDIVNENLVDFSNLRQINTDTVEFLDSSTLKITASKAYAYVEYDITQHFINNLNKTLTFISKSVEQSGTFNITLGIYYNDGTATKYQWFSLNSAKNKGTYLISEEDTSTITKVTFRIMTNNSSNAVESSATIEKPMLLIGTEEKPYIPHQSQMQIIPFPQNLCKIGDYADTIERIDGRWKIVKRIGKQILNGSENWNEFIVQSNGNGRAVLTNNELTKSVQPIISNKLKYVEWYSGSPWTVTEDCMSRNPEPTVKQIYVYLKNISTLEDFKTKLSENPVEIYYVLATPEYIDLPDETQAILNNIKTYKNISNIYVDGIGSLKVVYKKDLETIHKNQENRMLALENAVIN